MSDDKVRGAFYVGFGAALVFSQLVPPPSSWAQYVAGGILAAMGVVLYRWSVR